MHANYQKLEGRYRKKEPTEEARVVLDVNHKDTCVEILKPPQKDLSTPTFVLLIFGVMVVYCVGMYSLVKALNGLRYAVDEQTVALHLLAFT